MDKWEDSKNLDFITEAGWYFKTLAAQEPGNIIGVTQQVLAIAAQAIKDVASHSGLNAQC